MKEPKIEFIHAGVETFNFDALKDITEVYHMAATRINRSQKYTREGHVYNADAGFNVVDYCARNKVKLYFSSTASVYQNIKRLPILEEDTGTPHTIYGAAKLYTENLIHTYNNIMGLDFAISRFFSVYGPRMDNEGAYTEIVYNWLSQGIKGSGKVIVNGNPEDSVIDMVYVDDVVDAIITMTRFTNGQTFNVATQKGTTLLELFNIIKKITKSNLELETISMKRNDIETKRIGDSQKLRQHGWEPKVNVEEGIRRSYEWLKEQ
jgi:UDP-glucose 4-epimerase